MPATYQQLTTLSSSAGGLQPESLEERILSVLAIMSTGTFPDGTAAVGGAIGGLTRRATTGGAGVSLVNGTPTLLTYTLPNDSQSHLVIVTATIFCTGATTGGAAGFNFFSASSALIAQVTNAYGGNGVNATYYMFQSPASTAVLPPGATINLVQSTALTAGAATLYGDIWSS